MTDRIAPSLAESLTAALGSSSHGTKNPSDQAAVRLAELYAQQIDDSPDLLAKLGPLLLGVLEALGMTPRGRAAVMGKGVGPRDNVPGSKLDELHRRRAARQHPAAAVD